MFDDLVQSSSYALKCTFSAVLEVYNRKNKEKICLSLSTRYFEYCWITVVWVSFCLQVYILIEAECTQHSSQTMEKKYDVSVCFSPYWHQILLIVLIVIWSSIRISASITKNFKSMKNTQTANLVVKRGFSRKPRWIITQCMQPLSTSQQL